MQSSYLKEAEKLLRKVLRTIAKFDAKTYHVLMESYLNKEIDISRYKVACQMFRQKISYFKVVWGNGKKKFGWIK